MGEQRTGEWVEGGDFVFRTASQRSKRKLFEGKLFQSADTDNEAELFYPLQGHQSYPPLANNGQENGEKTLSQYTGDKMLIQSLPSTKIENQQMIYEQPLNTHVDMALVVLKRIPEEIDSEKLREICNSRNIEVDVIPSHLYKLTAEDQPNVTCLAMDYFPRICPLTKLSSLLHVNDTESFAPLQNVEQQKHTVREISLALRHIHANGCALLSLCANNVFVDTKGLNCQGMVSVRLLDFLNVRDALVSPGTRLLVDALQIDLSQQMPLFQPPEYVSYSRFGTGERKYDARAADVWALGALLMVLRWAQTRALYSDALTTDSHFNHCLFAVSSEERVSRLKVHLFGQAEVEEEARSALDLLEKTLRVEAGSRVTIEDVLAHPWLKIA